MHVHAYEKGWMIASGVVITGFVASLFVMSAAHGFRPPSHVETIDPVTARSDPRFAQPGVTQGEDGVQVVVLAQVWSFLPGEIRVPAGAPVTFRLTSPDVIHGFQVVGTNVNVMVIPGYVSEVRTSFAYPGEYLITCNEYCGAGHHVMSAKLVVTEGGP